jgi:adenosine deaminase
MAYLRDQAICLEMCPTSNWLTRCVPTLEAHPLPAVLRAGIPVCVNTDDPGIFDVSLPGELRICRERMGISDAELAQCMEHARRASFI